MNQAQKINQYSLSGTFLQTFASICEAKRNVPGASSLGTVLGNRRDGCICAGFFWKPDNGDYSDVLIPQELFQKTGRKKKINQYSFLGKYLRTFDSIAAILRETEHTSGIYGSLLKNKKGCFCGGYYWKYDTGDHSNLCNEELSDISRGNYRQINQYSLDGEYLATYMSIAEAKSLVKGTSTLYSVLIKPGNRKYCAGYLWEYDTGDRSGIKPYEK